MSNNKLILPTALIGGSVAGYLASPISNKIVSRALVNKLGKKVDEFKKTMSPKQTIIYAKIIKRTEDLSSFSKSSIEYNNIKQELYGLKDELTQSLSKDQMKKFTEIEDMQITLSERLGYTTKITTVLSGIIAMSIAYLNKKK